MDLVDENKNILNRDMEKSQANAEGTAVELLVLCVWPNQACTVERVTHSRIE